MKLKLLISGLLAAVILAAPALASAFDAFSGGCAGAAKTGPVCTADQGQQGSTKDPALTKIHDAVNIIALVAGVAAVIIIVYSALTFATAGGATAGQRSGDNPARARTARSTLTGAVIGLVLVALAWTIVTFVSNRIVKT